MAESTLATSDVEGCASVRLVPGPALVTPDVGVWWPGPHWPSPMWGSGGRAHTGHPRGGGLVGGPTLATPDVEGCASVRLVAGPTLAIPDMGAWWPAPN